MPKSKPPPRFEKDWGGNGRAIGRMTSSGRQSTGAFAGILSATGLAVCVIVVALVEEMGLPETITYYAVVGGALAAAAAFGLSAPTMRLADYFAAGRSAGAFHNGLAMVAGLAFLAFFGVTSLDFTADGDGAVLILGPTIGILIAGLLIAPAVRRTGALTVPEYLAGRLGGSFVRPVALLVLVAAGGPLLAALMMAFGRLASYFVAISYGAAVFVAVVAILAATILGGARGLLRSLSVQFLILFVAYLLPPVLLAVREYGLPAPAFLVGQTLHALGQESGAPVDAAPEVVRSAADSLRYIALVVWLALGAAALPHLLTPAIALREAHLTRKSVAWATVFCIVLFTVAPGYAVFARLTDIGIFALPKITGMPFFLIALLVAGGLAALTAAAAGLALALANAIGHDLYYSFVDRRAPQGRRLVIARLLLIAVAALAAWFAVSSDTPPMPLAALSFSFAAAGLLPALIATAWWPRATALAVAAGMAVGALGASAYVLAARLYGVDLSGAIGLARLGNPEMAAAFFGLPLGVIVLAALGQFMPRRPIAVTTEPAAAGEEPAAPPAEEAAEPAVMQARLAPRRPNLALIRNRLLRR